MQGSVVFNAGRYPAELRHRQQVAAIKIASGKAIKVTYGVIEGLRMALPSRTIGMI
jgi:hypothetical protein